MKHKRRCMTLRKNMHMAGTTTVAIMQGWESVARVKIYYDPRQILRYEVRTLHRDKTKLQDKQTRRK